MMTPTVLYVVSEPWYFVNHRLEHAQALLASGFRIEVATRRGDRFDEAAAAGCVMHEFDMARGLAPWEAAREIVRLRRLVRVVRPQIVHAVALKPVALCLPLLAALRRPALVLSVNGMGLTAVDGSLALAAIRRVLRWAGRRRSVVLLFQTRADQRSVTGSTTEGVMIPGVGVDLRTFLPRPKPPPSPLRLVFLGRAVRSKGLIDLVDALSDERLVHGGVHVDLYCATDEGSPGALDAAEMARIRNCPLMTVRKPTSDPAAVLGGAHAAILPSQAGEGVSRFVLEALATGTPVLLSSESGSGEVIEPGRHGLVFSARNPRSIADTLVEFGSLGADERDQMGRAGRELAEKRYSSDVILPEVVALHRNLLAGLGRE
jgi:glycosyltransferase involved in cell wall biosynthesis